MNRFQESCKNIEEGSHVLFCSSFPNVIILHNQSDIKTMKLTLVITNRAFQLWMYPLLFVCLLVYVCVVLCNFSHSECLDFCSHVVDLRVISFTFLKEKESSLIFLSFFC